ncbi:DNA-formamidopyrimidine glycosylase family protein [Rhodococcus artemisiae]|uniref:DNA-(apurinic or apyrimidinic site) lyase n=1 Tax=Rhodococcus artemisiae TaxID=714159 RepID=A0ABU7L7F6_9NOCA|nr:DNA-formamidopyrimidine glycosylase family protein [Rhodococcus artemisiae]MEE2057480.1 DNA-formamidopyrimidine glycosylase family protein [Rhodococcus artemisiae]
MPEGDTVFQAAARLHAVLAGNILTESDFRVPRLATADLTGETVEEVAARGKHILVRLPQCTFHSHLMMDGQWHVYERGSRWRKPGFRARAVLGTERMQAVGFDLGIIEVLPREKEADAVGHLGPDLLGPDWDPLLAAGNLTREPDRPIGLALLDQRIMAGVGNVYRSELCFLRGVDPATPVRLAGDPTAWAELAHRVLHTNRNRTPRVTTGDLRRGRQLWVYGRRGQPCLRCGLPIESGTLADPSGLMNSRAAAGAERVVYRCPGCQPPR